MTQKNTDLHQTQEGLSRIASLIRSHQWQRADPEGLSATQSDLLSVLVRRGALRVTRLSNELGITQATASDSIAGLERKGMVIRQKDPSDGRASLVSLSPAGNQTADRLFNKGTPLLHALKRLDDGDRAALNRSISLLISGLQDVGAIVPQRLCITCRHFTPNRYKDADKPHHCAFVGAAFGDASLHLDCGDHEEAEPQRLEDLKDLYRTSA